MTSTIRKFSFAFGRRSVKKYKVNSGFADKELPRSPAPQKKAEPIKEVEIQLLDERCIVKVGYLVKSPTKTGLKNKIARWHLRWFLLYDTQPLCDLDNKAERKVELLYYKNHQEQEKNCQPLGRFNLQDVKIFVQSNRIRGYQFVISVVTQSKCMHLCATQGIVYQEWLQKLKIHRGEPKSQANDEVDDGIISWDKSGKLKKNSIKKENSKKKQKKMQKSFYTEEQAAIDSPSKIIDQPFKTASKFFEPCPDDVIDLGIPLPRRARSNTTAPLPPEDEGSSWDISKFTGPTTCFNQPSRTILRQKSNSTSMLLSPHQSNTIMNRIHSCKVSDTSGGSNLLAKHKETLSKRRKKSGNYGNDESCMVYSGYLTKSPPLEKIKNRVARWHLRYFVLYDTIQRINVDPTIKREATLVYYKNCFSFYSGDQPLGRINLEGARVYPVLNTAIHGYPFAFVVDDGARKYYLCSTQQSVADIWLLKLQTHIPLKQRSDSGIDMDRPSTSTTTTDNATHDTSPRQEVSRETIQETSREETLWIPRDVRHESVSRRVTDPDVRYYNAYDIDESLPPLPQSHNKPRASTILSTPSNQFLPRREKSPFITAAEMFLLPKINTSHSSNNIIPQISIPQICETDVESNGFVEDEEHEEGDMRRQDHVYIDVEEEDYEEEEKVEHLGILENKHAKAKVTESMFTHYGGNESDTESGISRTSSESSTSTTYTIPRLFTTALPPPYKSKIPQRNARASVDSGFSGPKLFPHRHSEFFNDGDKNNNIGEHFEYFHKDGKNTVTLKPALSRVQSKSLDSIHTKLIEMNVSTLFDKEMDEILSKFSLNKT